MLLPLITRSTWLHSLVVLFLITPTLPAEDWPQWMGPKRDGTWQETGLVEKFPEGGPKVLWRTPIGHGYAGPAVVGNRVFVTDYLTKAKIPQPNWGRTPIEGTERVLCLNADTGKVIWEHKYPRRYALSYPGGPRCTPTVHQGKVYALGAEGDLICLNASNGKVLWSKNLPKEYKTKSPWWGYAGHPLIDGQKLITKAGGKGSGVVALDKDTGKEIWKSLDIEEIGYAPPTLITAGGKRQLIIWHGKALCSLAPETGKLYWEVPLQPRFFMSIMAPRKSGDYLFAGAVFGTCCAVKLGRDKPTAEVAWRGEKGKGLYPMNMTPLVQDGILYGIDHPGQIRAVKVANGEQLWESWLPVTGKEESRTVYCGTAFVVKNADRFFLFNEKGELIIARLSPRGYQEVSRAKLLEPTGSHSGRKIVWSHPAFARKCVFARNDKEIVCVLLAR